MNAVTPERVNSGASRSARFHLWRSRKDKLARWLIGVGGISVIWAVVLIFFYLLWVVLPLFLPATVEFHEIVERPHWLRSHAVWMAIEEQQEVGLRLTEEGGVDFFTVDGARLLSASRLPVAPDERISAVAEGSSGESLVVVATSEGRIHVFGHRYETDFSRGVEARTVVPSLEYPFGSEPLFTVPSGAIADLAISAGDSELLIAALMGDGLLRTYLAQKRVSLLTGETSLETTVQEKYLDLEPEAAPRAVGISGDHRWIFVADRQGRLHRLDLPELAPRETVSLTDAPITELSMLLGGISVLAGDAAGGVTQAFPVRDENNRYRMEIVRRFNNQKAAITRIIPEARRKGFVALDAGHVLGIYHSTAGQRVLETSLAQQRPTAIALSPRANGALVESGDGRLGRLAIENEHPEISISSLWRRVWYENYQEPEFVWQSSAATNDFEPKFSLSPLVFGTMKAALYAMLFAMPLALMGAAYTAYFMAPELRKIVKPTIEIMAALPTVILGFIADLWFAPWVEEHLAAVFMILLVMPVGLLLFAWLWHRYDGGLKPLVREGWEPVLLLPVLIVLSFLAMWLAEPVQALFFDGDLRNWLSQQAGITYDQRNALVVGCAMGFAVIPTIFSIAEDAVYGVPETLSNASLALGATPWQTMVRVVLPTASPGIFSALMIGLGRAVGETMIVLMATGNTPIMDWNLFEGMRTLAANIAVEMPESEVNSSHYRVLFLAALVLFMFTFVLNTGAEIIRQRLREKYSNL